ncbi:MAG TPA: 3-hydroxyacyl-CoA dehydrogenase NAD-binding domain-containing protein [Candidatus Acidoferrales bacterium]|nr:3-hydroxyacyl-CoA dehydrogenase NAD-binding domain-containing protein [Candidatus Acidoferrales bacterium]
MAIETITIIGAAAMGRAIAYAALAAGYRVILEDVLPERLAAAQAEIGGWFDRAAAGGRPAAEGKERPMARLSTAGSVDLACREAHLVMETLPQEMEMKIDVFCILEKFARPGAILATNAASLSITEIAAVTTRGEHCVGLRFCNAAPKMNLLEIVRGRQTSDETVERCREVGRRMGKEVVVMRESS